MQNIPVLDWRPITGCSPISTGCANCVGMKSAAAADLTTPRNSGPVWSGVTRLNEDKLFAPEALAAPTFVQVCANGDLFHGATPDDWIDAVFSVIERNPRHGYSILTKRADRMASYLARRFPEGVPVNIQIGVSAERQVEADDRITALLSVNAATRFVFFYPLLGPITAAPFFETGKITFAMAGEEPERPARAEWFSALQTAAAKASVPLEINSRVLEH